MVVSSSPLKNAHISKIGPQVIPTDSVMHIIRRLDFPAEEARKQQYEQGLGSFGLTSAPHKAKAIKATRFS